MICLVNVPYRLNKVQPLSLAILKALINKRQSVCLDFSPEFNSRYVKILLEQVKKGDLTKFTSKNFASRYIAWAITYTYPFQVLESEVCNEHLWGLAERIKQKILGYNPRFVCFSAETSNLAFSLMVAKIIKGNSNVKVIVGGVSTYGKSHIFAQKYPWVDCFVEGEAEPVFQHLVDNKKIPKTLISPPLLNLNESPIPDHTDLNLSHYELVGVETQRGCSNSCAFCANRFAPSGPFYREKSVPRVKREVELLTSAEKPFYFCDNITNPYPKRVVDLCEAIMPLKIRWECEMLPRISWKKSELMARSGCRSVALGCESLNDKVLKDMNKPITFKHIQKTIYNLRMNHIQVNLMIIMRYPTETIFDALKTCIRLLSFFPQIQVLSISDFKLIQHSTVYKNPLKYHIEAKTHIETTPLFVADYRKVSLSAESLKEKVYSFVETLFRYYKGVECM